MDNNKLGTGGRARHLRLRTSHMPKHTLGPGVPQEVPLFPVAAGCSRSEVADTL
jgi:hypothetical protein